MKKEFNVHDIVGVIPREYPGDLVSAVSQRNDPSLGYVDGDGVSKVARRTVPHRFNGDVVAAVRSKHRTIAHVHPTLPIAAYSLGLQSKTSIRSTGLALTHRRVRSMCTIKLNNVSSSKRTWLTVQPHG